MCPAPACIFECSDLKDWQDHIAIEHDGRPYICEKCDFAFTRIDSLKKHEQEVHKGIREHVCPSCGFAFVRRKGLNKHLKNTACRNYKKPPVEEDINEEQSRIGEDLEDFEIVVQPV